MDELFANALTKVIDQGVSVQPCEDPTSPRSRFGKGGDIFRSAENVVLEVPPDSGLRLRNPVRNASLFRSLGMVLWNLCADNRVSTISCFNPNAAVYSDDGSTLRAPWGPRLFADEKVSKSPVLAALDVLSKDPNSLRAVVPVFRDEDLGKDSVDIPCLVAICFSQRESALQVTAQFRALNAFSVFPHDHALIACVAEACRAHLRLPSVRITYFVRSLHVAESDLDLAMKALDWYDGESATTFSGHSEIIRFRDSALPTSLEQVSSNADHLRDLALSADPQNALETFSTVLINEETWASDFYNAALNAFRHENES